MIITQTPLRISFAGGGSDLAEFYVYEEGKVISTAIDKYIFVIVTERFDNKIYVNGSIKEIVNEVKEIKHELVRECLLKTGIKKGIEVTILADIPSSGSGLGSSSSLTVGLLNAFYLFIGQQVPASRIAEEACEIEIEKLKKPIGKQDQYIAAYGGFRKFAFKTDGTVDVFSINTDERILREFASNILLFFTNITRKSSTILKEQQTNTNRKYDILLKMTKQVDQIKLCLEYGNLDKIGLIMREGWELKKQLASKISNRVINDMYKRAINAGALGGKISGAGGGGFLTLYVPKKYQNSVREALSDLRELPFLLERDGSKAIFNYKRYFSK